MFGQTFRPAPHFHVGERFNLPVKKIVQFGCFFELCPGFDALLHVSKVPMGDLSAFKVGQIVETWVCSIDSIGRVQLALCSNTPPPPAARSAPPPAASSPLPPKASPLSKPPDESAVSWRNAHPREDAAAVAWLREITQKAPLHATCLAELRARFGVPTPFAAWVRLHADEFVSYGPRNPLTAHPCCGLVSKVHDHAYWRDPIRVVPPMVMSAEKPAVRTPYVARQSTQGPNVQTRSVPADQGPARGQGPTSGQGPTLLLDGSNLVRTLPGGGKSLSALLLALDQAGRHYNVLFDANIKHVLEERQDVVGMQILANNANRVTIVPAGTPADDYLLLLADRKGYAVISNDRFEQYRDRYAWLSARVESADRRLYTVAEIDGELVSPTLGLVAHI